MSLFKGLIICKKCGKKYNGKLEGKTYNYICSGYKNYGSKYCPRNILHEKDIISVVKMHLSQASLDGETVKENINRIEVDEELISIFYKDGSKSEWNNSKLKI
jgi:hypothetical protein